MTEGDIFYMGMIERAREIDDPEERWLFVNQELKSVPKTKIREELKFMLAFVTAVTSGEIATLSGDKLTREEIRRKSKIGEMPAPIHQGTTFKWYWWNRWEVEEWLEKNGLASVPA